MTKTNSCQSGQTSQQTFFISKIGYNKVPWQLVLAYVMYTKTNNFFLCLHTENIVYYYIKTMKQIAQ